ncbi:hypothetical protein [Microvirga aerophila]|uniref:Uncharacterized protein n=1 Tax=Microvirga aerophila TaxID=670291 RepID=A0A512BRJ7_9HYPH|nr:hypothetical protein [Microvirga aerophila]GEO14515.1 hypothetical protein MAE02_22110 [Microvirga aerophila]
MLWVVAIPVTVLGVTWIVMRGLREIVVVWLVLDYRDDKARVVIATLYCYHQCCHLNAAMTSPGQNMRMSGSFTYYEVRP